MNHGNRCLTKLLMMVALVCVLPACTSFNPYQQSDRVAADLKDPAQSKLFAGRLGEAMADVHAQREAWFSALSSQAKARALTAGTLIGLGTAGVIGGVRAGVASASTTRNLALAGGLAAGAYSSFSFFTNDVHEKAYIDGYTRLTCAIAEMRPVMLTSEERGALQVEGESADLKKAYTALDAQIAKFNAAHPIDRNAKTPAGRTVDAALTAAYRARDTQRGISDWLSYVDSAGFMLRREAELIVARVAGAIQAGQNKIDPQGLTSGLSSIVKAYRDIKLAPDDTTGAATGAATPAVEASKPAASAPSTANESEANTPVPVKKAAEDKPGATETAKAEAAAAQANTPVKDADTATLLEAAIKRLQVSNAASAEQAKASALEAKSAASEAKQFANQSAGYCNGTDAAAKSCNADLQKDLTALAMATANLYAARRPLSNRLANFNTQRKTVRDLPGCGGGSLMRLNPGADATIEAGKPYEINIHNPEGMPALSVNGPATGEILVRGSLFVARITPTEAGTVNVTVTDAKGGSDDVVLTVKAPSKH